MIRLPAQDADAIRLLLGETPALTLSTINADGTPRATPLYFAFDEDLRLLFLSDGKTMHAANLKRDAEAAAALYPAVDDWRAIRGLQLKGRVECLGGAVAGCAELAVYVKRFPFAADVAAQAAESLLFRFEPTWMRLIDNRRGFGFQREWHAE
jgi:uncharacterized protein YhbP (UPF0306 family)